ncbi:MFS transporter [Streptomyces sulphureus]|uniref:MFS transporter n=1 Tax=Streptomyces sulphureus TaxID=47758 RepID=UPI0003A3F00D|nr:MFS transporter [Streptomyces sulphureus]
MATVARKTEPSSVAARLERLPHSRWHVKVRLLIGVVTFFEAFDQLMAASALPVLTEEWGLSGGQATFAITSGSVGMLVGALGAGWLGDRMGRVRTVALGTAVTAVFSVAVALSTNIELFALFRFVQGLGIGGVVPVAATYINEIVRSDSRGKMVLLYELIFPAGLTAATLVAAWVVPNLGWRALFLIGGLPILVAVVLRRHVPESPRWLLAQGREAEAAEIIARIEDEVVRATKKPLSEPDAEIPAEQSGGRLREIFTGRYLKRTVVLSTLWFVAYYVNHGIAVWLPSLYTSHFGFSLSTALYLTVLSNLTGLFGSFVMAMVIDRVGRRPAFTFALGALTVTLAALAIAGATSGAQVAVFASVATLFVFSMNAGLYLYSPELYPTRNRAMGASFGGLWNRLGVILGPIVVGAMMNSGASLRLVFLQLACVAAVGALVAFFSPETKGKTLEELNS